VLSYQLKVFKVPKLKEVQIALLFLFILIFPKAGVKVFDLPITLGFFFLLLASSLCFFKKEKIFSKKHLLALLSFTPFQLVFLITIFLYGFDSYGYMISFVINYLIFPYLFFLLFPSELDKKSLDNLFFWIKKGVFFLSLYGVFLFFYKVFTGRFIEIPFLTVNYHDYMDLEKTKCIDRGGIFKLISTYNNGNLFGVCMLMILPLYTFLEKSFLKKGVVKVALLLTLSRTIWVGWVLYEIINILTLKEAISKKLLKLVISQTLVAFLIVLLVSFSPFKLDFILDRFLGNRIGQLEVLNVATFFPSRPFWGVYEVVYLGVIYSLGYVGLIAFLCAFIFPFISLFFQKTQSFQKRAAFGLFLYLILCLADGAFLLIPVGCFCLFLILLICLEIRCLENDLI